jgi:hypothetical protein
MKRISGLTVPGVLRRGIMISVPEINQMNRVVTEVDDAHHEGSQQLHADPPTTQDKDDVLSTRIIGP